MSFFQGRLLGGDLLLDLLDGLKLALLTLPLGRQLAIVFPQRGEVLLLPFELFSARFVLFLLERFSLDFQLHDPSSQFV